MKLVKFLNCDAPCVSADELKVFSEEHRICVISNQNSDDTHKDGARAVKSWHLSSAVRPLDGGYWLLGDDNTPIGPLREVLLATREAPGPGDGLPAGVEAAHADGVDLRSKAGRRLQRTCEAYGQTFRGAAKNAALLMDAERLRAGREEKMGAERKRVIEAVEKGEEPTKRTRVKAEKRR